MAAGAVSGARTRWDSELSIPCGSEAQGTAMPPSSGMGAQLAGSLLLLAEQSMSKPSLKEGTSLGSSQSEVWPK